MIRFAIIISLFTLLAGLAAFAQTATLMVEKRSAQIGEPINLQIKLKLHKNDILFSEGRFSAPEPLELVGNVEIDSSDEGDSREYEIRAKVTTFDDGNIQIGPFYFGRAQNVATNVITANFTAPQVDTSRGFRDIKPPLPPSRGFWDNLPYALFIVIVLLGGFYFYRRLTKKASIESPAPKAIAPPYDKAMRRLIELRGISPDEPKKYYSDLSFVLKDYFSEVWRVNALESTTEELLLIAEKNRISRQAISHLQFSLQLSDLAKFAKFIPTREATEKALQNAIEFVESTREFSVGFDRTEGKNGV